MINNQAQPTCIAKLGPWAQKRPPHSYAAPFPTPWGRTATAPGNERTGGMSFSGTPLKGDKLPSKFTFG